MFYYFGRKKRIAANYPDPLHDAIIEPFGGSAAYSLHGDRWKREVWVNERDERIVSLWRYLQAATPADIQDLPMLVPGERLSSVKWLSEDERLLMSLHIAPGKNQHNDVVSRFSWWGSGQRYIAANLHKISHWTVTQGDFAALPDVEATWFIDPPYHRSGRLYRYHDIDYLALGEWVQARQGLLIACEQEGADWLPFRPLMSVKNAGKHVSHEVIWVDDRSTPRLEAA